MMIRSTEKKRRMRQSLPRPPPCHRTTTGTHGMVSIRCTKRSATYFTDEAAASLSGPSRCCTEISKSLFLKVRHAIWLFLGRRNV